MTIEFKPGDKVKKKSGEPFSNGGALEATVDYVKGGYMVYFLETKTWIGADRLEKVENGMDSKFKVGQKVVVLEDISAVGSNFLETGRLKKGTESTVSSVVGELVRVEGFHNSIHHKFLKLVEEDVKDMTELKLERPDSDHYHTGDIDVWKFAEANFDYDEVFGFHKIDAIKYLTRFGKKNGRNIRDLEKARAEIDEMIRMEMEGK